MLPDEQYIFLIDTAEKKRIARGSHNKRTHCGKGGNIKFPSDFMSKKEREAMNGEVKSYNLNKPMVWKEIRKMPRDLQITYIKKIRNNYDVPDAVLAESFGLSQSYISQVLSNLGLGSGLNAGGKRRGWRKSEKAKRFYAWWEQGVHETSGKNNEAVKIDDAPEIKTTVKVANDESSQKVEYTVDYSSEFKPFNEAVNNCTTSFKRFTDATRESSQIPNGGSLTFDSTTIEEASKMLSNILGESIKISLRIDWTVLKED